MSNPTTSLPPGFRFHPTDEELILHYLKNRVASTPCPVSIIAEVDIYKFDPWNLPDKAMFGDKEWYFFSPRDRKYPNGVRPNRAAGSGYWKATGTDKPIHTGNESIGVKKALVFYKGRPPKGMKTNWIMHEYRLAEAGSTNSYKPMKLRDHSMRLDDWVLCRIYKKTNNLSSASPSMDQEQEDFCNEETYIQSYQNISTPEDRLKLPKSSSVSEFLEEYASLSHLYDVQPDLPVSDFNSPFASPNLNQQLINYCNNNSNNDNGSNYSAPYQLETESPSVQDQNSPLKRQRINDSCLVTNFSKQFDGSQYMSFFNQQMLLNSHFGLH